MKKLVLVFALLSLSIAVNAQKLEKTNWTIGHFKDDFEEKLPGYPFYWLTLDATGRGTDSDRISVCISHRGFEFVLFPQLDFDGLQTREKEIKIKLSNGTIYNVPFHRNQDNKIEADIEAFDNLMTIFDRGNFTISIIGYVRSSGERPSLIAKVTNETRQIMPAFRNMQKIWKRYGTFD